MKFSFELKCPVCGACAGTSAVRLLADEFHCQACGRDSSLEDVKRTSFLQSILARRPPDFRVAYDTSRESLEVRIGDVRWWKRLACALACFACYVGASRLIADHSRMMLQNTKMLLWALFLGNACLIAGLVFMVLTWRAIRVVEMAFCRGRGRVRSSRFGIGRWRTFPYSDLLTFGARGRKNVRCLEIRPNGFGGKTLLVRTPSLPLSDFEYVDALTWLLEPKARELGVQQEGRPRLFLERTGPCRFGWNNDMKIEKRGVLARLGTLLFWIFLWLVICATIVLSAQGRR